MEILFALLGLGLLAGSIWLIERLSRISGLLRRVHALEQEVARLRAKAQADPQQPSAERKSTAPILPEPHISYRADSTQNTQPETTEPATNPTPAHFPQDSVAAKIPAKPISDNHNQQIQARPRFHLRDLMGENPVVRIGLVVFLLGVTFLIRLASQAGLFPPEARLATAALLGIGLLGLGWHFRKSRPAFALPLQGGGVGIFFLVLFSAHRIYHLLPPVAALPLVIVVLVLTGILAVRQSSLALAYLGLVTGFVAPIAMSTGSGNHIGLFTYYALLDAAIFGIALFRSWRSLHLTAFLATYIVATTWGFLRFSPEHFQSCEIFLWVFYLLFSATSLAFARRDYRGITGYVDGTLIFGLPIATFALQGGLVEGDAMKLSWTAAFMGLHQMGLGLWLWKRIRQQGQDHLRPMAETLAALGILFGSLAIPLAFSAQWTSLLWAFEGLGLLWLALRQNRSWTYVFGVLLILLSCSVELSRGHIQIPTMISAVLAAWLGAWLANTRKTTVRFHGKWLAPILLSLSWIVLAHGCAMWVNDHLWSEEPQRQIRVWLTLLELGSLLLLLLGFRLRWAMAAWAWFATQAVWILCLIMDIVLQYMDGPKGFLSGWGWWAWAASWTSLVALLYPLQIRAMLPRVALTSLHAIALYAFLLVLGQEIYTASAKSLGTSWPLSLTFGSLASLLWFYPRLPFFARPFWNPHRAIHQGVGLSPWAWLLGFYALISLFLSGFSWSIPWIPLFNPTDLSSWLSIFALAGSAKIFSQEFHQPSSRIAGILLVGFLLLWLGSTLNRCFHHFAGLPWNLEELWHSHELQMAWSLFLTIEALGLMWVAAHKKFRSPWIVGAILLGVTMLKLFLVDLSDTGAITRIVSFLGVGALMVAIGYFSPLPPRAEDK